MNYFPRVFLNAEEEKEIRRGFPWVFDNEISHVKIKDGDGSASEWKNVRADSGMIKPGTPVEVYSKSGGFLGTGIFNANSKITVRIISDARAETVYEDIAAFWDKRIRDAYNIRQLKYDESDSYRLIFAEADFVPGFICERYCDEQKNVYLVVQFLSMSCEIFRKEIISALERVCSPYRIFERSDADVRLKEGLELKSGWIGKKGEGEIVIVENGIKIKVDFKHGQKTGYFLDQKQNRAEAARFCRGKTVLDTFSHTGAFGLNAFAAGAKSVTCVDISPDAVKLIDENIALNGAESAVHSLCADVFDVLKQYESEQKKFDVIILDPPAFTKSARNIQKAYGGYKEINLRAMRLLNAGGILITCSCSHFFDAPVFYDMLTHAASDAHRRIQILEKRGAGYDHPVLLGYPKSEYLKCAVARVL